MKKFLFFTTLVAWCMMAAHPRLVPAQPVRIGYLQSDIHQLACWVALEKGFYKDEGIQVEVAGIFKAGPEQMSAFAAGALDAGYVGVAPATTAVANGVAQVTVLAQVNTEGSALVVGKDSPIQCRGPCCAGDLPGNLVAVPGYSTVQDFLLQKALAKSGIEKSEVPIMVLKPPEMIGALRTGQIAGFIAWEPYPAKALTMDVGRILVSSREIWEGHPCCVLAVQNRFLKTRPEDAKALVRAHVKATDFINQHPAEALRIGVRYTGMDEQTVAMSMKSVIYTYELSIQGTEEYVRFLSDLRYIDVANPKAFVNGFINGEFLREIMNK